MSAARWVSLNQLHAETGLAVRTLQYIRTQEPGVLPTRIRGKVTEYKQPDCAINLRKREVDRAVAELKERSGPDDSQSRLDRAKARRAEIETELLEKSVVRVDHATQVVDKLLTALRAQLVPFAKRWAPELIGAKTIVEMEQRVDRAIVQTMQVLSAPSLADSSTDDALQA